MSKIENVVDSNNKFLFWFDEAKKICEENRDAFTVFDTNEEFITWILSMMPENARMSAKTVLLYLYKTKVIESFSDEQKKVVEEFREWFAGEKAKQQMALYKKMMTNNACWQREDNVLAKRFGTKWQKRDRMELEGNLKVTHSLCDKLRKLTKDSKDE